MRFSYDFCWLVRLIPNGVYYPMLSKNRKNVVVKYITKNSQWVDVNVDK